MRRAVRHGLLMFVLLLGLGLIGPVAADPFAARPSPPGQEAPGAPHAWQPVAVVGHALLAFQRETNRLIALHMRAIRAGESSSALLIGIGLAFLYGVVHALGPGHGKLVVVSYFLSREARVGRGLLMGLQIALFHVLSAMIVVALADLVLRRAFGGAPAEVAGVRLFSYGLIALIGGVMLVQAIRRSRQRRAGIEADGCCGVHAGAHDHGGRDTREQAQQGALSLGVGLVPCTGAVLILLYAVANDILFAGMLLVAAIAAGMAMTMGGLGILSVVARRMVASRVEAGAGGNGRLAAVTDYAGALAIMTIGAGLFWATL
jgi:ABC-type nickel/cobalt efflux system permease component RcnA